MDILAKKVEAAATALWLVILIAVAIIILQWVAYLAVMYNRPGWVLWLWGPDMDWNFVQMIWFWAVGILKFIVWLMILAALWLTLWAEQLKKRAGN